MTAGNYSFADLDQRIQAALIEHQPYLDALLAIYESGRRRRQQQGWPTLAVLGMGRAGKDTVAEYIGRRTSLHYAGSSSTVLCRLVASATGLSYDQAWQERHQHRDFWLAAGNAVRAEDLTLLSRLALGIGDTAVGLRGREEVLACRQEGVVDLCLWVRNSRVPADPTVEFTEADCDLTILNEGTLADLYARLDRLLKWWRLLPS